MGKMILNGTEYGGGAEVTFANGLFIDADNVVCDTFTFDGTEHTWTATADCILTDNLLPIDNSTACYIKIDGKQVSASYVLIDPFVYVKTGQVVAYRAKSGSSMKAYGVQPASNVTFIPDYASACYSTEEREVGCWTDGKPLYQKTITFTTANTTSYTSYATNIADPETIMIDFDSSFVIESGDVYIGISPYLGSAGADTCTMLALPNNGVIRLDYICGNNTKNRPATVTLLYTKTTDVAGSGTWTPSGARAVHYSENEQVIGTWVDGKPLYEKTFINPTNGTDTGISNSDVIRKQSIDMEYIVDGYTFIGSGSSMSISGTVAKNPVVYLDRGTSNYSINMVGNGTYNALNITVQYTKSTD